jgi:Xaa-Pro aminopeptidase
MLTFEPLTMAPIDRACIEPALLTAEEAAQLNAYHARVLNTVGPLVPGEVGQWLKAACAPL